MGYQVFFIKFNGSGIIGENRCTKILMTQLFSDIDRNLADIGFE
jgi:hypothetical protein